MVWPTGGGAATNAGIDFQARVAAYFMTHMALEMPISTLNLIEFNSYPVEIFFETSKSVDDINVHLSDKTTLLIQAKRTVNLSESQESDFGKSLKQFIADYASSGSKSNVYILAIGSGSSSKVRCVLKKILNSIRANKKGLTVMC
ncbi:MAG: hypothetical protein ACK5JO_13625 [Halodesulfovibrio sp.]